MILDVVDLTAFSTCLDFGKPFLRSQEGLLCKCIVPSAFSVMAKKSQPMAKEGVVRLMSSSW